MAEKPNVGVGVHYVSYGTPGGEYPSACRAAIVTAVEDPGTERVDLCVLNPEGLFFNRGVAYDSPEGDPGDPDCPSRAGHGAPFRYCGERGCGWTEPGLRGGTWHWPHG